MGKMYQVHSHLLHLCRKRYDRHYAAEILTIQHKAIRSHDDFPMAIIIDSYMCVIILTNGTVWQVRGSIIWGGGIHRTGCTVIISCCAFVETLHTFSTYTISIEIFSRNTKSCKTSQSNYNSVSSGMYTILICS